MKINLPIVAYIYSLFGFKITIIDGIGSGIRIDDLLAAALLLGLVASAFSKKELKVNKPILLIVLYCIFGLFSAIYNAYQGRVGLLASTLFSIRHIEYAVYAYAGYALAKQGFHFEKTLKIYIIYASSLVLLQNLGVIGGVTNFSLERALANTGGPWEFAAICAFLCIYHFKRDNFIWLFASFTLLILSASRITLAATLIVLLFKYISNFKYRISPKRTAFGIIALIFLSSLALLTLQTRNDINVVNRYSSFLSQDTYKNLIKIYKETPSIRTQEDYFSATYGNAISSLTTESGDVSAYIRFTRWIALVKSTFGSADTVLLGLGPSFAGLAVDGSYVRFIAETGLIGFFIYIYFIVSVLRETKDSRYRSFVVVLAITALFIDIFFTYKAMLLFWVYYGKILYEKKQERKTKIISTQMKTA